MDPVDVLRHQLAWRLAKKSDSTIAFMLEQPELSYSAIRGCMENPPPQADLIEQLAQQHANEETEALGAVVRHMADRLYRIESLVTDPTRSDDESHVLDAIREVLNDRALGPLP